MGIGVADFDDDGWTDLFVANDTVPSFLFMNNRNGTFTESAFERAVAFTERAEAVSGMGADARDVDNDGLPDIFQTALANETFPLFRNMGKGMFEDVTTRSGVAHGLTPAVRLGQRHRRPQQRRLEGPVRGLRRRHGLRAAASASGCRWRTPCSSTSRTAASQTAARARARPFARKAVHRGAAFGDIDNDGRVDVVVTALDGAARAVAQRLAGAPPLAARQDRGHEEQPRRHGREDQDRHRVRGTQYSHVNTAVGYGCASDRRVHFGLGARRSGQRADDRLALGKDADPEAA